MVAIRKTAQFDAWLRALRDARAKAKIISRIERLGDGNAGDVKPVGNGISEMRIHYGPGYRVYYCQQDETIVIILCGGEKDSQAKDIQKANEIKESLEG